MAKRSSILHWKGNRLRVHGIFFICLIILYGCGGNVANRLDSLDENSASLQIIINDDEIKDNEDSSKLVDALKEVFGHSFKNVSVRRGYDSAKVGELVIIPQHLSSSADMRNNWDVIANVDSTIKVSTFADYKVYSLAGSDVYKPSIAEKLVLVVPFVGNATEAALKGPYVTAAKNKAMESMVARFYDRLVSSREFSAYVESVKIAKTLPAALELSLKFIDTNSLIPNNTIDAAEESLILATITNNGKGTAFDVRLDVDTDYKGIIFDKNVTVGDIQPNETKEIKINLKAGLDIGDGKASFMFNIKEKRGYDAKKVALYVPTAKLESPQLEIVSTEINDGDTGLAKGNGNGIIESGETIELIAFIKNQGVGNALGVNLNGLGITSGVEWVRGSALIGTVAPGETIKSKIAFTVPRNFDEKEIITNLKATDSRGVSNAEKKVAFAFAKQSPDIQYAYNIYSRGNKVSTITNGGEYEIELFVSNKGKIPAKNVIVNVASSAGIGLSRRRIDIGEVKEQASISGQRFTLSVPRTFIETQAPLNITILQSDFFPAKSAISIPVDVKSPKLRYIANLQSKSGGNNLEQGEQAIMEVYVLNEGNLPAEGVRVKIDSQDENLKIIGQTDALIGKIPAGSKSETIKFQLSTFRRIKIGDAYLAINVAQHDFAPVISKHALNIREEGVTVVDVASEDKVKPTGKTGFKKGPAINIKAPLNAEATSDETVRLAFEVSDARNVESVKVLINGSVIFDEMPAVKKKGIAKNVSLKEGSNEIVIVAYNADNISSRKELTVTRTAEDDVDTPLVTGMNKPEAVAVVIGISKYENRDIPTAAYAKKDAEVVKKYLINTLGFKEANIKEFYDEQATSKKLESYFKTQIKNKIKSGLSDVFIFYSGHGVPESNRAYFAPYDFDPTDIATFGYPVEELYKQMENLKAKSITVVIDACFSGFSGGEHTQPIIKSASPVFFEVSNPLLRVKNSVVFTSSTGKQIASWYDKKQHGIFTYYFLQGLRGKADMDHDGKITVKELEKYLIKKVPEQARLLYNREQTPEVMGNKDAVLVRYK